MNIRSTFEVILRNKFEIKAGDYYVVADRASENLVAFGRRYICCFAHQLDNCYKWAIRALKAWDNNCPVVVSLKAMRSLTTYCNRKEQTPIKFTYKSANNRT